MKPVLLLNIVGLTPRQIGADTPNLRALAERGAFAPMSTVLPAVTCSAQATMLTGRLPGEHGVVGNGWFDRDYADLAFWRQSNRLVQGEKVYEAARRRDPAFTCAKLFWWWNMGAAVDWSITPRPYYPADGRKIPATYAWPADFGAGLEAALGRFPFFDFWGPKAGLPSSRWIADAAIRTLAEQRPSLTMAYLPHLDYDHQRYGPRDPRSIQALRDVDAIFGDCLGAADSCGAAVIVVSEYGIMPVDRPVHVNRALREAGLLVARETPTGETLDVFGSRAFAVADHQVAHVYARDDGARAAAREVLEGLAGIERVLALDGKREHGLDHPRAGDLVAVAAPDSWFTYYYWLDESAEPDFARSVDIHRKPGYDPCEMFLDPALAFPKLRIARRLAQKFMGLRYLMDVIPVDASLVRGSHGRLPDDPQDGPVFISSLPFGGAGGPEPDGGVVPMCSVQERVLAALSR